MLASLRVSVFESPWVTMIFLTCISNEDTTMLNTSPPSSFWCSLTSTGFSRLIFSPALLMFLSNICSNPLCDGICLLFLHRLFHVYNVAPPSHQNLRSQLCHELCSVSPSVPPWARGASSKPCQPALHLSFRRHPVVNVTLFIYSVYKAVAPGGQRKGLAGFVLGVVGTKSVLIR